MFAAILFMLTGCSTVETDREKEKLKEHGIETHGGTVMRVFHF